MPQLSSALQQVIQYTRLDAVGRPSDNALVDAYIIFKEFRCHLRDALQQHPLTLEERQQLATTLLTARTKLQDLMAQEGASRDHDGRWFLRESQNWAAKIAAPEFEYLP